MTKYEKISVLAKETARSIGENKESWMNYRIGTWVGKKGNIDIVAQNSVRESIVGICNWSEPYMTRSSGEALLDNLKQAKISAKYLYMFSAQEFAEDLKQMAEEDKRFVLIDMKEL